MFKFTDSINTSRWKNPNYYWFNLYVTEREKWIYYYYFNHRSISVANDESVSVLFLNVFRYCWLFANHSQRQSKPRTSKPLTIENKWWSKYVRLNGDPKPVDLIYCSCQSVSAFDPSFIHCVYVSIDVSFAQFTHSHPKQLSSSFIHSFNQPFCRYNLVWIICLH